MPTTVQRPRDPAGPQEHPDTDIDLLERSRTGDTAAYAQLWERHHDAVRAAARRITRSFDPDDLTQEAFSRTFAALKDGRGPHTTFRPYLFATVRNLAASWSSADAVAVDPELFDAVGPTHEFESELVDRTVTARAFRGLPDEWRAVLWYVDVEGMSATEVAPLLGLTPNAVAALTYRAREGLRRAWIDTHASSTSQDPECVWTVSHLSAYVRSGLTRRKRNRVEDHLTTCTACAILAEQLDEVASSLRGVLAPLVLGPAILIGGTTIDAATILPARPSGISADQAQAAASQLGGGGHNPFLLHPKAAWGLTASIVAVTATTLAIASVGSNSSPEATASPLASPPTISEPSEQPATTSAPTPEESPGPSIEPSAAPSPSDASTTSPEPFDEDGGEAPEPSSEGLADPAAPSEGRRSGDVPTTTDPTVDAEPDPSPSSTTPAPVEPVEPTDPDPAPAPAPETPALVHPDPGSEVRLRDIDGTGTRDDLLVWIAGDPDRTVVLSLDGGADKELMVTEDAVPYFVRDVAPGEHTLTVRYADETGEVSVSFIATL